MMSSESKDIDETLMEYVTMRCQVIIQQIVTMLIYKRLLRLSEYVFVFSSYCNVHTRYKARFYI